MANEQYIKLPDGSLGKFPGDMPDAQIHQLISRDFPDAFKAPTPPEVNRAIASVPRPPDAIMQTRRMSILDSLQDESQQPVANQARSMVHGQVVQPKQVGREAQMPLVGDVFGLSGYPEAVAGVEGLADVKNRKDFYHSAAQAGGGAFQAAGPFMMAAGTAAPRLAGLAFGGSIAGGKIGEQVPKWFNGSPEAQEFGGFLGSVMGGSVAGVSEFYRGRYRALVDKAKADMRANRQFGTTVDEGQLQQAAEAKVQKDIAQGNSLPELGKEGAHLMVRAAQAAAFAHPAEESASHFGVDATSSPQTGSASHTPVPPSDIIQSTPEAQTRPVTPVERIKNLTSPPESDIMGLKGEGKVFTPKDLRKVVKPVPKLGTQQDRDLYIPPDTGKPSEALAQAAQRARGLDAVNHVSERLEADEKARKAQRLQDAINEAAAAKAAKGSAVGGVAEGTAQTVQPHEPAPATATAKGSGEPVRPAEVSEVTWRNISPEAKQKLVDKYAVKPVAEKPVSIPSKEEVAQTSERLGSRKALIPTVAEFDDAVKALLRKSPNMAEGTAKRMVADRFRKERGSLSFEPSGEGGPEDIKARREKKINDWVDRLRHPDTPPEELDRIMKNLKAYGLDHDEIIRRVSGAEGFAEKPKQRTPAEDRQDRYQERLDAATERFREFMKREPNEHEQYKLQTQAWNQELKQVDKIVGEHINAAVNFHLTDNIKHAHSALDAFEQLKNLGLPDEEIMDRIHQHPKWQNLDRETKEQIGEALDDASTGYYRSLETGKEHHIESEADASLEERAGDPSDFITQNIDKIDKFFADYQKEGETNYPGADRPSDAELNDIRATSKSTEEYLARRQAVEEGRNKGASEIGGVKSPDIEELERMYGLKDERGSLSFRRKRAPVQPNLRSSLRELSDKIDAAMKAHPPDDHRMKFAERLDKTVTEGWDKVQMSMGRLTAQASALHDWYMRPPTMSGFRSALGRFSGALNRSAAELFDFTRLLKDKLPNKRSREAITNWIQAGGDDKILADRAQRSKGSLRAGYEAARTLTQDQLVYAKMAQDYFDIQLKNAIKAGLLQNGIDNYVPQVWKKADQAAASTWFSSLGRSGVLKPDFNAARHRILDSYFEGEQKGFVPQDKDIGHLITSWTKAMNQAVASKNFIRDLTDSLAADGKPVIAPFGSGKAIDSGISTEGNEAYLIYPKGRPEEYENYRSLDHPAMTKWKWVAKDDFGNPIFMKGDMGVHPDHFKQLDNIINRGKWAAAHPVQSSILKGQAFFKATLLSMSPFHQIQEGTHALFHKVNPFSPPALDLYHPTMTKLLDNGLVIGNHDPIAAFDEGLNMKGGLVGMVPGLGGMMQKYSEYLFQDYIPRLKGKMAMEAYERNIHRYSKRIAAGDITTDQIAELTANQANAAFGELNYMMIGRSAQTQAYMRMGFLAPDFLEARARFAGQALRPYGREQQAALIRGAVGLYAMGRILNQLLDDNPHWDKPFSLVVHGYEYKMRSLPGDIWNMLTEPRSFLLHRLNPISVKPLAELGTGKDDFGRRRTLGEWAIDTVRGNAPIPTQGLFKSGTRDIAGGLWSMVGVSRAKYRSKAAAMAHGFAVDSVPADVTSHHIMEMVRDIDDGSFDSNKVSDYIQHGQMNPNDVMKAIKLARLPEIYRDFKGLTAEQKAKVWAVATPFEKAQIRLQMSGDIDTSNLLPEQRQEFRDSMEQ